jgi:hypothetical protein
MVRFTRLESEARGHRDSVKGTRPWAPAYIDLRATYWALEMPFDDFPFRVPNASHIQPSVTQLRAVPRTCFIGFYRR